METSNNQNPSLDYHLSDRTLTVIYDGKGVKINNITDVIEIGEAKEINIKAIPSVTGRYIKCRSSEGVVTYFMLEGINYKELKGDREKRDFIFSPEGNDPLDLGDHEDNLNEDTKFLTQNNENFMIKSLPKGITVITDVAQKISSIL